MNLTAVEQPSDDPVSTGPVGTGARRAVTGRRTAPLVSSLAGTVAAGALAFGLVGCSAMSPAVIATPYAPADGIEGTLSSDADGSAIRIRNLLLVAGDKGGRGVLVGTLVNSGDRPAQVQLALAPGDGQGEPPAPVTLAVPARGTLQLDAAPSQVVLDGVPAAGRLVQVVMATRSGGSIDLTVPVLAPQDYYETVTPTAPAPTTGP